MILKPHNNTQEPNEIDRERKESKNELQCEKPRCFRKNTVRLKPDSQPYTLSLKLNRYSGRWEQRKSQAVSSSCLITKA
jgi:hypothetical protein